MRHDGGHRASSHVMDLLAPHLNLISVCPEVEAGMGTPREPVELVASDQGLRMVGVQSQTDHTDSMKRFAVDRVEQLAGANLCGYIFKASSPSCGLEVAAGDRTGRGLFSGAVLEAFPDLPVIEEAALSDARLREGFVERVFAYSRLERFFSKQRSVGQLAMVHAQVRLQLNAHDPAAHGAIQQLFTTASEVSYLALCAEYRARFMEALREPATVAGHFGVLKQVFGQIKPLLGAGAAKELARALQDYRLGSVPLSVPLTLVRHYVRVQDNLLLNGQTYLDPEPKELLLRMVY